MCSVFANRFAAISHQLGGLNHRRSLNHDSGGGKGEDQGVGMVDSILDVNQGYVPFFLFV